ncbi:MAG: hypothetical protein JW889_07460 [Verrucomicrobia bacterium]|nr:hypothetical protein [Verrucomicrobiota bacterium]
MRISLGILVFCLTAGLALPALAQRSPVINEFVFNHAGTDDYEFIEVFGEPGADLSAFWIIGIEGDSGGPGVVDNVFNVGTTDASGFWTTGFVPANTLENGTLSLLLVVDFLGNVGEDLDANDDGVLDSTPWGFIADAVAVFDGGISDWVYTPVLLAPDFDGGSFAVGGASRIPNGLDTDTVGDWMRNDFDGAGLPGLIGTPVVGEALNTPGTCNLPVIAEPATLGIAALGGLAVLLRRRRA